MILVFDEAMNFDGDSEWFIALDEGALASVSPDLAEIEPNDLGMERSAPAPLNEKVITKDWEVTVLMLSVGMKPGAWQRKRVPTMDLPRVVWNISPSIPGCDLSVLRIIPSSCLEMGVYMLPQAVKMSSMTIRLSCMPIQPLPVLYIRVENAKAGQSLKLVWGKPGVMLIFQPTLDPSELNKRFLSLEE